MRLDLRPPESPACRIKNITAPGRSGWNVWRQISALAGSGIASWYCPL